MINNDLSNGYEYDVDQFERQNRINEKSVKNELESNFGIQSEESSQKFVKSYLESKNISLLKDANKRERGININDFVQIFGSNEDAETLKIICQEIDYIRITDNNFDSPCQIPECYRIGIQVLDLTNGISVDNLEKLHQLFPNAIWERLDITETDKALKINPENAFAYVARGVDLWRYGDYRKAINNFKSAIDINPECALAYAWYGLILSEQGKEAEEWLRIALELDPENAMACCSLGDLLARNDRLEEAEKLLQKATKLNPKSNQAHLCFGTLLKRQNRFEEAKIEFQRTIEGHPGCAIAYIRLGDTLARLGCFDEAKKAVQKAEDFNDKMFNSYLENYESLVKKECTDEKYTNFLENELRVMYWTAFCSSPYTQLRVQQSKADLFKNYGIRV